jgi:alpha-galactosidase
MKHPFIWWMSVAAIAGSACQDTNQSDGTSHDASPSDVSPSDGPSPDASAPILAATPPMGWNSWYGFRCSYNEQIVRETADAMVATGLRDQGYLYVALDDCWQSTRDAAGKIVADPVKFPSGMAALADYVHGRGLKLGVYTDVGPMTCKGLPGSYNHEVQDAATYAAWGVDLIKEDWCYHTGLDARTQYRKMQDAIARTHRPMVLSICNWGEQSPWEWAPAVGQLWRTTPDIADNWSYVLRNLDASSRYAAIAGPGHWNDPDFLQVGLGALTTEEYRSQVSLWAVMSAPLILSMDLRRLSPDAATLVANPEVIAVDQDARGAQGTVVATHGSVQVWSKPLEPGARAVVLFNRDSAAAPQATVSWLDLGLADGAATVRDLWAHRDLGPSTELATAVPAHGVVMVKVTGREADPPRGTAFISDLRWAYAASGYGPAERDRSNNGLALDGNPIRLRGQVYPKGLGVHAESRLRIHVAARCTKLHAVAGIDDEVGPGHGSVVFEVWADGARAYRSPIVTSSSPALAIEVPLERPEVLELVVRGGGVDVNFDHADWADARVICDP